MGGVPMVRRRAWWFLVLVAVVLVIFGIVDMATGAQADPGISLAIAGVSPDLDTACDRWFVGGAVIWSAFGGLDE